MRNRWPASAGNSDRNQPESVAALARNRAEYAKNIGKNELLITNEDLTPNFFSIGKCARRASFQFYRLREKTPDDNWFFPAFIIMKIA